MTDKLSGIKAGDRVRVTFEGVVQPNQAPDRYALYIAADGRDVPNVFHNHTVAADTFRIERIEKPLGVGDRVRGVASGDAGEIIWMNDTYVVIVGASHQPPLVKRLDNVERIS